MKLRAARMKIVKASRKAGTFNPVMPKANGNGNGVVKPNGHAVNPLPILQTESSQETQSISGD
jgi:hypothetical protein